jgi:endonuclease/exonuclease/phosphatase family metal-dependent hydrolase
MTNRRAVSSLGAGREATVWLFLLTVALLSEGAAAAETHAPVTVDGGAPGMQELSVSGSLRVLTLNLAHGRKDALNQVFLTRAAVERNLAEVAALLREVGADVVALQEADGPSRWSGSFDHVAAIAGQASYPWQSRASHAKSWLFDYGTALLSRVPFTDRLDHAFRPSPPSMTKGLTLGQLAWRPDRDGDPIYVDVVSVHLDFSRDGVRKQQVAEMAAVLSDRTNPMIILGDFNSDWFGNDSVVTELAHRCGMQVYQPLADDLGTYPSSGRRLDWVLISDDLEFLSHEVLPQVVSDHHAVVATIGLRAMTDTAQAGARGSSRCTE